VRDWWLWLRGRARLQAARRIRAVRSPCDGALQVSGQNRCAPNIQATYMQCTHDQCSLHVNMAICTEQFSCAMHMHAIRVPSKRDSSACRCNCTCGPRMNVRCAHEQCTCSRSPCPSICCHWLTTQLHESTTSSSMAGFMKACIHCMHGCGDSETRSPAPQTNAFVPRAHRPYYEQVTSSRLELRSSRGATFSTVRAGRPRSVGAPTSTTAHRPSSSAPMAIPRSAATQARTRASPKA
jgi:hypothetical protein